MRIMYRLLAAILVFPAGGAPTLAVPAGSSPTIGPGDAGDTLLMKGVPLLELLNGGVRTQRAGTAGGPLKNLAEFGTLDPTGTTDMAPIFNAAIQSVPAGAHISIVVPNTTGNDIYMLGSDVTNQWRDVDINLNSGASVGHSFGGTGPGILYVNRVTKNGSGTLNFYDEEVQGAGNTALGESVYFRRNITNNGGQSGVGQALNYTNLNTSSANSNGGDFADQVIAQWPNARFGGMGMAGHWWVTIPPLTSQSDVAASAAWGSGGAEFNPVNNGPESTFTEYDSLATGAGIGVPVTGSTGITMQPDRADVTGGYGASDIYGYGCVPYPGLSHRPMVWAQSTAYNSGTYVTANGNVYLSTISASSAAGGTGPSGTFGSIVDGGQTWSYVGSAAHVPTTTRPLQPGFGDCLHIGNNSIVPRGHGAYFGGRYLTSAPAAVSANDPTFLPGAAILARHLWQTMIDTTGATFSPAGSTKSNGNAFALGDGQAVSFTNDGGTQIFWDPNANSGSGQYTFTRGGTTIATLNGHGNLLIDSALTLGSILNPGAIAMTVQNGSATCTHTPTTSVETVSCSSDKLLKRNIQEARSALDWLTSFHVREFDTIKDGSHHTGVIAQEVQKTHPELVHELGVKCEGIVKSRSDCVPLLSVDQPDMWKLLEVEQELYRLIEILAGVCVALGAALITLTFVAVGRRVRPHQARLRLYSSPR